MPNGMEGLIRTLLFPIGTSGNFRYLLKRSMNISYFLFFSPEIPLDLFSYFPRLLAMFADERERTSRPLADRIDESEEDVESRRAAPPARSIVAGCSVPLCYVVLFVICNLIS